MAMYRHRGAPDCGHHIVIETDNNEASKIAGAKKCRKDFLPQDPQGHISFRSANSVDSAAGRVVAMVQMIILERGRS